MEVELERLHQVLGWKRLSPGWAKAEILGGLLAVSIGMLCGIRAVTASDGPDWPLCLGAVLLMSLGGCLALAGHRSHLYQSQNRLVAYLLERLAGRHDKPQ